MENNENSRNEYSMSSGGFHFRNKSVGKAIYKDKLKKELCTIIRLET